MNRPVRGHSQHQPVPAAIGPVSLGRPLAWADPSAAPSGALWPAYRLVYMHAPRMTTFAVLWRTTVDDLVERLLQRLAWQQSSVVGLARLGVGR